MVMINEWRELERYMMERSRLNPSNGFAMLVLQHRYSTASYVLRVLRFTMEEMMVRGKKAGLESVDSNGKQWTRFVNISMQGVDWADVLNEYGDADTVFDGVSVLCGSGHRVGISFNPQTDAFIVSVTCKNADSPNDGCTFTSFANTWFEALQVALYKHFVVTHERWLSNDGPTQLPMFG